MLKVLIIVLSVAFFVGMSGLATAQQQDPAQVGKKEGSPHGEVTGPAVSLEKKIVRLPTSRMSGDWERQGYTRDWSILVKEQLPNGRCKGVFTFWAYSFDIQSAPMTCTYDGKVLTLSVPSDGVAGTLKEDGRRFKGVLTFPGYGAVNVTLNR